MCIAIYKPQGKLISWEAFKNAEWTNDDGWGFAARTPDNRLVVKRGVDHFNGFRAAFDPFIECQAIIHFRMRTHGAVKKGNCHPFMVSSGLAVIHNGVVPIDCNVNKAKSDTWHFNELVLRQFYNGDRSFWRKAHYKFVIEQMSGGSKFCFLRADGAYSIYNEDCGHWNEGSWFSNRSYVSSYGRTGFSSVARSCWRDEERYDRWWDSRTTQRPLALIGGPEPKVEETGSDSADGDEAALREYERQIEEAAAIARGEVPTEVDASEPTEEEDEKALTPEEEQEAAVNIAARLYDEGMSAEAIAEVDDIFGVDGLEALADMIPEELK